MGTTRLRLPVVVAVGLLSCGGAAAQLPTAPPPHPPLAEVVKEYQRLGLPLPPPDAELVRIEYSHTYQAEDDESERLHESYLLGFKLAPTRPGADPRYLIGEDWIWSDKWFDPRTVKLVEPTPKVLDQMWQDGIDCLYLAVQCELRGWHDLARSSYALARQQFVAAESEVSVIDELRNSTWRVWARRLGQRGTDRKEVLRRLKQLAAEDGSLGRPEVALFLNHLELTVASPMSKPGTVEARIDALTDYWSDDTLGGLDRVGQEAYWELVELGFDAVPSLIEHLGDARLTRGWSPGFMFRSNQGFHFAPGLTVGHLCSRLLHDLSGRTIGDGRLDPEKASEWFAAAKKIGEEKWLLDHAIPTDDGGTITNQEGRPENLIVRVIGAKYPKRLPDIYRAILRKPASYWLHDSVVEIAASKLPRAEKVALFEEGAGHKDITHRLFALECLADVDPATFRKHLLNMLQHDMVEFPLVRRADSRECWDAFAAAAKRAGYDDRMTAIMEVGWLEPPDKLDPIRRERIRFLMQFLDDRTVEKIRDDAWDMAEVRDYAASRLGGILRLPIKRRLVDGYVEYDKTLGPLSRLILREVVRQAAEQELARLGNK